jgi:hypothetical protein
MRKAPGIPVSSVASLTRYAAARLISESTAHFVVSSDTHPKEVGLAAVLAIVVGAIFGGLGVWHFAMALAPFPRDSVAVPYVNGRPLFVPSVTATAAVGVSLFLCALLVLSTAGVVSVGLSPRVLSALCAALALGLLLRAVGDFRYVGFFKSVRDSRFATVDTWCYSPACLALAIGVAYVATH